MHPSTNTSEQQKGLRPKLLRIAYLLTLGFPLVQWLIHLLFQLRDHSLAFLVPLVLVPVLSVPLMLSAPLLTWPKRIILALKHLFLLFLSSAGSFIFFTLLDIAHCGFEMD